MNIVVVLSNIMFTAIALIVVYYVHKTLLQLHMANEIIEHYKKENNRLKRLLDNKEEE